VTSEITKGEREELRRIVRGDFKALKMEIDVRRAEMVAEIEKRVASRFMAHEEKIAEAEATIAEIAQEANAKLRRVVMDVQEACDGYAVTCRPFAAPAIFLKRERREEMRTAMIADLDARCAHASAQMARQENDLLKKLASGALESQEAKAFLMEIPKVSQLVPASRLEEFEKQFAELPPVEHQYPPLYGDGAE